MLNNHPWYSLSALELQRELAERFKNARLNYNWTQQELANKIGVSRLTISRMEAGENISLIVLIKWLKVFKRLERFDQLLYPLELIDPKAIFKLQQKHRKKASCRKNNKN